MKARLERLNKLTLAAESALAANDLSGFQSIVETRRKELESLAVDDFADAEETLKLDARLQAAAARRMDGMRTRMRQLSHLSRTIRAAGAARTTARTLDLSG
ncbi:MAG TPA: hypothetical protein VKT78_17865 [Fimbriimonadaceae bacterium]|nr:hypothetical protein [Fimbriimonadaceae bacterium]